MQSGSQPWPGHSARGFCGNRRSLIRTAHDATQSSLPVWWAAAALPQRADALESILGYVANEHTDGSRYPHEEDLENGRATPQEDDYPRRTRYMVTARMPVAQILRSALIRSIAPPTPFPHAQP